MYNGYALLKQTFMSQKEKKYLRNKNVQVLKIQENFRNKNFVTKLQIYFRNKYFEIKNI